MLKLTFILILGLLGSTLVTARFHRCPPDESIRPCACNKTRRFLAIICTGLNGSFLLQPVLGTLKNYTVDQFAIQNSRHLIFWPQFFKGLYIKSITFKEASIDIFFFFEALKGLETSLEAVTIRKCNITSFLWKSGTHFARLSHLTVSDTLLPSELNQDTTSKFPRYIKELTLSNVGLRNLGNQSLARFYRLEKLDLSQNSLTSFNRNWLQNPAYDLWELDLSDNKITSEQMNNKSFAGFPSLENLILKGNRLSVLGREVFHPVWDQLEHADLKNNGVRCDCGLSWVYQQSFPPTFFPPHCVSPIEHQRKTIKQLTAGEVCNVI